MSRRSDHGASAVEYGLLIAAIAALVAGLVFGFGHVVQGAYDHTGSCLQNHSC
jgi:pilus assembly protein Flp/PilA